MPAPNHPAPDLHSQQSVPPMRTDRLALRPIATTDLDAVHGYLSREDVCQYLLQEPMSREEVAAKLADAEKSTALANDGDFARLAVVRDSEVVGEVMLNVVSVRTATAEIGWIFSPHAAGRGYATEGARALLGYAFDTLNAHRVVAHLHPENTASSRLCERLGMRQEALHRADLWIKGHWEDTSIYAILRQEWATAA